MLSPLKIAHVVFRLDYGGLENGLVNLLNRLPADEFEHIVIALTEAGRFRSRLPDRIQVIELHQKPGKGVGYLVDLWRVLRAEQVDLLHTRNLACLEAQLAGLAAGVRMRVHGEHGWDVFDLEGRRRKYRWLRKAFKKIVGHYVVVSRHLMDYLRTEIGVPAERITHIVNGVDTGHFRPGTRMRWNRESGRPFVIGSVARMEAVKDYMTLARAMVQLARQFPGRVRLEIVGDGSEKNPVDQFLQSAGLAGQYNLPGFCDDVGECMRRFDIFVLPSLAEGISNTILEAMASGLPVVASRVGGNPELVEEGVTGMLFAAGDPDALAASLRTYIVEPELLEQHGQAARVRAETEFSIPVMVARYADLYRHLDIRQN